MPTRDLQTHKVTTGPRTYFFDIAKSSNGFYLRMSCNEKGRESFNGHRLFVFEEDLSVFVATLKKTATEIERMKSKVQGQKLKVER